MIRVAICDDHQIVRAGFKQIFSSSGEFEVVAEGATGREALDIARREICDVLRGVFGDYRAPLVY